jgi:hypothetical protein
VNRTILTVSATLSLLAAGSALAGPKSSGSGSCAAVPVCCKTLKTNCCQLSTPCCEHGNTAFFTQTACTAYHARPAVESCAPQSASCCADKSGAATADAEIGNAGFFRRTAEAPARRAGQRTSQQTQAGGALQAKK